MQLRSRRIFILSWTAATLLILTLQIVALLAPPTAPGTQRAILLGPATVVF